MSRRIISSVLLAFSLTSVSMSVFVTSSLAWSNGGYSADPSNPDYGTHDWIAHHALDWLPTEERLYIIDNLAVYLYGTELPDNWQAPDGIGDSTKHHIYYNSAEVMTDDDAAVRASTEYSNTLSFLKAKDYAIAAKNAGIMSHYIVDMAVFGHVMGSATDWGTEVHHTDDYEPYVNARTSSYSAEFDSFLSFDGSLSTISAYDAAKNLAYDTTFDVDGDLTCVWMDQNYDWSNLTFKNRAGESLNLAVNYLTDVLHTLYLDAAPSDTTPPVTTISLNGVLGDNNWFTTDVTVTLSATDDTEVDKTEYSFDSATWTSYMTPFAVTNEGNTVVYYNSTDKTGNPETAKTKEIKIDKTIPSGTITINKDASHSTSTSVTLDLTSTDATSCVYQVRFSNDDTWDTETWENPSTTKTWALPSEDGTKTVYYQIKDKAGLTSTCSDTIILDTTPPTGLITIAGGTTHTNSTSVTLALLAEDNTSGVAQMRFSHDNVTLTEWEAYATSRTWTLTTGDGTKTVYVQFIDNAGLISLAYQDTIILDTAKPTANAGIDQMVNIGSTVTLDANGSTDNVGIVSYAWDFGDGSTEIGMITTHTYTQAGTYTVTLTVKDSAGNKSTDTLTVTVSALAEAFPMWAIGIAALLIAGIAIGAIAITKRKT